MNNNKLKFSNLKKILNHCFTYNFCFITIMFFSLFFCDFLINEKNDFIFLNDHPNLIKNIITISFIYLLITLITTIFILFKYKKILLKGNKIGTYENGLSIFLLWTVITFKISFDISTLQFYKYESFSKLCKSFQLDLTLADFNLFITYLFFLFCSFALYKQLLENIKN